VAIFTFGSLTPAVHEGAFVAENATIVGHVRVRADASVWYGAVLRSEFEAIEIGEGSNVQDNAVLHTDPGFPATVGRFVTIGHGAIVHGATLGDGCLIGLHATVLNGARVGAATLVAAGAVVLEGADIPARVLVAGVPAKVIRSLRDDEVARLEMNAVHYVALAKRHRSERNPIP